MPTIDPRTSALVLIDLQRGIVANPLAPRPAEAVVAMGRDLAARFRAAGAAVVLVHVDFGERAELAPSRTVDEPLPSSFPPDFADYVDGLVHEGDILVAKHHWGAFTGTDLDLQLRRRGVRTIAIGGIATNFGVESTARSGWELGYDLLLIEDACTSRGEAMHRFAVDTIFPRIGRVVSAADIVLA